MTYERGIDCSDWAEKQYEAERCGTHPVGRKRGNGWGMHDMLGNVRSANRIYGSPGNRNGSIGFRLVRTN